MRFPRPLWALAALASVGRPAALPAETMGPPRPRILGVAQVAFYVHDLAVSRHFYHDFLGCDEMAVTRNPEGGVRFVLFKIDEHQSIELTGSQVAADLNGILTHLDQPTGDGINTYYASQAARAGGVTVALSGLGGDELFGGYDRYRDDAGGARRA